MSRVLSLALVLVMLLGIMPLALAAGPGPGPGPEENVPGHNHPNNGWTWVDDTEHSKPASCKEEGLKVQKCSVSGCPATQEEKIAKLDHTVGADVAVLEEATCMKAGKKTVKCAECDEVFEVEIPINPNAHNFDPKTGKCTNTDGAGKVCDAVAPVTEGKIEITGDKELKLDGNSVSTVLTAVVTDPTGYTHQDSDIVWSGDGISANTTGTTAAFTATEAKEHHVKAVVTFKKDGETKTAEAAYVVTVTDGKVHVTMADVEMTVSDDSQKVEAVITPAGMKDKVTVAYSSSNPAVIDVNKDTGALDAKRDGKVTITAKLTASEGVVLEKNEITCTVTAKAGAVISCADEVTDRDSVTLTPVLKDMNGKVVEGAKFSFEIGGKIVESKASSYTVKRTKQGVTEVIVRVAEYPNGDVQSVSGKRVLVSFYDTVDATVHIAKDTFMFDDTGVFSAVEIGNRTQINPKNFSMTMLWNNSGVDYSYIKLKQDSTTTRYGVISYPGSDWNAFVNWKEYSPTNVKGLKFTGLEKGKVVLEYELTEKNMRVQEGTITIVTSETGSDITYRTTYGKSITFNEMDFQKLWNKQYFKSDLSYVMFDAAPDYGNLYRDKQERNKVVYAFDEFYIKAGRNELSLSDVTYAPDSSRRSAYDVSIPFTMYGKDSKDKYNGVLTIKMNDAMPFRDVNEKDWFYNDVQYVYTNDIMNGLSAYEFGPQNTLTRGMVVTMLHRMEGKPRAYKTGTFTDVASGTWYTEAVEWAAENNIVNGYGTTFGPNNNITRQDLAVILYRYAQYKKMNTYSASSLTRFSDYQRVASYATNAMEWAVYNKIMNGNDRNMLSPAGNATRAEAAKMFHVFLELK